MKYLWLVVLLIALAVVAYWLGWSVATKKCMEEPPPPPQPPGEKTVARSVEWSKIAVEVNYRAETVVFDERTPHDTAVVDGGSTIEFTLICTGCPTGDDGKAKWTMKKIDRAVDLTQAAEKLIQMHRDDTIRVATREELGLIDPDQAVNFVPTPWVDVTSPLEVKIEDDIPYRSELWKYYLEVCLCDSGLGDDCSLEPTRCFDIDPHVWAHERL